jgi:hypothetical protein
MDICFAYPHPAASAGFMGGEMPGVLDYLERRPPMPTESAVLEAFDALYDAAVAAGPAAPIDYRLPAPRWQFICHIADTRPVVLHGSGNPSIARFEPRQPLDNTVFGNQHAVYAASDGLWPMYFAILDRDRYQLSLVNGVVRVLGSDGLAGEPHYFFSISYAALPLSPWRRGTLYFLPRDTFDQQPHGEVDGRRIEIPQWASPEPVTPLARIEVGPEDFPLLGAIRGHDPEETRTRARKSPDGFPWID